MASTASLQAGGRVAAAALIRDDESLGYVRCFSLGAETDGTERFWIGWPTVTDEDGRRALMAAHQELITSEAFNAALAELHSSPEARIVMALARLISEEFEFGEVRVEDGELAFGGGILIAGEKILG